MPYCYSSIFCQIGRDTEMRQGCRQTIFACNHGGFPRMHGGRDHRNQSENALWGTVRRWAWVLGPSFRHLAYEKLLMSTPRPSMEQSVKFPQHQQLAKRIHEVLAATGSKKTLNKSIKICFITSPPVPFALRQCLVATDLITASQQETRVRLHDFVDHPCWSNCCSNHINPLEWLVSRFDFFFNKHKDWAKIYLSTYLSIYLSLSLSLSIYPSIYGPASGGPPLPPEMVMVPICIIIKYVRCIYI